jgi:hypothetical protein
MTIFLNLDHRDITNTFLTGANAMP